jgi:dTDP-4-amino-4,6-dideoxygalactose transaminase
LHLQKAYQHLNYRKGDFPVTERVALEIVSLPMFPQLKRDQLALVTTSVKEFAASKIGAAR